MNNDESLKVDPQRVAPFFCHFQVDRMLEFKVSKEYGRMWRTLVKAIELSKFFDPDPRPWLKCSLFCLRHFFTVFSPDPPLYLSFSGNRNGGVIQYDTRCPNLGGRRLGHGQDVCGMAMSHNSHHVVTGGNGGLVRLWDLRTHQCFRTIKAHSACAKVWFGSSTL